MDKEKRSLKLTIEGEFTVFELASLISFVRGIDRDDRNWKVFVEDPNGTTLKEAVELLEKALPPMPGRRTTPFEIFRKQ